ncbi:MAG: ribose-phosphate diphosphokinase [Thermoprotei archaeon]|nr:MAG: ribose-phosphate diphosphokinase [Thermoprotei archaeon]
MIVVGGPASRELAIKVASHLQTTYMDVEHKVFPDGESYIRYPRDIKGEDIVIVQSLYYPQDKHLVELLLMIDTAKDLGARSVIAVIPYLAYARQDKRFREGEAISVKTVLKCIESCGADAIITVDVHKRESLQVVNIPTLDVTSMKLLAEYIQRELRLRKPLVLAPDMGALWRAKLVAEVLGVDYDYIEKSRDRITGEVTAKPKSLSVQGRDVIIIDDIIATGGTIALAAREVKRQGATSVVAACAHGIFVGEAIEKMKSAGVDHIIATDTIPTPYSKVTVAPVIAEGIKEVLSKLRK